MEAFARLPAAQYSTGWVLCCIGRAYYEMVDYPQAARVFEWARQVDPTRLQVRPLLNPVDKLAAAGLQRSAVHHSIRPELNAGCAVARRAWRCTALCCGT